MDFIEVLPVKGCCRLCLSINGKLHHLFRCNETETLAIPLSMKVTLCTSVPISKYDALPQKICQNCLNFVNDWYYFRIKCLRNNYVLKKKWSTTIQGELNELESKSDYKSLEKETKTETGPFAKIPETLDSKVETLNLCEKSQTDPPNLIEKISKLHNAELSPFTRKNRFCCDHCPDSFYFIKDLKQHQSSLHSFEKFEGSKASAKSDADFELEEINMRTRYEMKCCNKMFFSKAKFRKHYSEKHPGEKPFMCETCGKKDFISEETLKRHKILHTGKFRCEICFKTFTCNAILILHKRDKHENDRPFVCDVCGKRFVTELLMNYHKRFHTGEKKYVCEECGLAVVTSSSLAKHRRIHSKEKPHMCHLCGKGFVVKSRLVEHLRVHTGERPFKCPTCEKGFTMRDKLKRHVQIHSGEKLFSCEYCGHSYSTRYGLSVHLKSHA